MAIGSSIVKFSVRHPKTVTVLMVSTTITLAVLAALPSIWPGRFSRLNPIRIDTDPENMLPATEPVRVFNDKMKKEMTIYDMLVLGIVNDKNPNGVFNPTSLKKIYELTQYAKSLDGVMEVDLIAPSTVDNIEQAGLGTVRFEWLMHKPPTTEAEALSIRDKAKKIPFLYGTLLSEDGKAICLYIPLKSKNLSYKISSKLRAKEKTMGGDEKFFITGLPVAEDTFGIEMFRQMAISAPVAMVIIFTLLLIFFRKLSIVTSPMIVAMVSAITTMSALIIMGKTVHIMSSMIPIFIMPIAVLDAIHILSEFFDRYQETKDRETTITHVMDTLFVPMLYTSLTTAAGFASLALTPIPPVQVFGLFIAFGVMVAWIWTVTFIPAFMMFIPEKSLANYGLKKKSGSDEEHSAMANILTDIGRFTFNHARLILVLTVFLAVIAVYGITKININDNPTKWFAPSHPIRIADKVLNEHFGGTYMGYLVLESPNGRKDKGLFKNPKVLRYISSLQKDLLRTGIVGKSNSLADIVKTVYRELLLGDPKNFRIPNTSAAVAQCLMTFQGGHRPDDLWHFVTPDYTKTNIWVQLKSGDNKDMARVVAAVNQYMAKNPPPVKLKHQWFGLTYINVIWQDKMVSGMLQAFLGSFLVVLLMMTLLFRSALWGLLSMIPLTVTILAIYGFIGLIGKDYDMPVAVLSSLSLGLAVDYAIHFLSRARMLHAEHGSWSAASGPVFGEPARAITRNVIVVGVGFLPLILAPLTPYKTVGFFISSILIAAGVTTLIILPALITLLEKYLFPKTKACCLFCNGTTCIVSAVSAVAVVAVNVHQFLNAGWTNISKYSIIAIAVLLAICFFVSRRKKCKPIHEEA